MKKGIIDFNKPILLSCESFVPESEVKFDIIDEKKKIVNERLAELDTISRNRCFYGSDDVQRSLKESKLIQELLANNSWVGELEHPDRNCDMKRFMTIDDTRVSHSIRKYWWDGEFLQGTVQYIPPMGDMVWRWITEANMNIGKSLRIYTPNYVEKSDSNGKYVIKQYPMMPVTFDCIRGLTGYKNVRLADPTKFAAGNKNFLESGRSEKSNENLDFRSMEWFVPNPNEQIKNMIESGVESHILEDLFKFDSKKSSIKISEYGDKITFSLEDYPKTHITVNTNTYLFNKIMQK
jgi:hypothetical protein